MPSSRHTALTLPCTCARSMTRRRIPCTLSSRVIGSSSHSGFLGRTSTLGKIGQMALLFVHGKCQHYYESGQASEVLSQMVQAQRDLNTAISELRYLQDDYDDWLLRIEVMPYEAVDRQLD